MSEKLESMLEESGKEKQALTVALKAADKSLKGYEDVFESVNEAESASTILTSVMESLKVKSIDEIADAISDLQQTSETYEEFGSTVEIQKAMDAASNIVETLADYTELGTSEEISEAIKAADALADVVEEYKELGSVEELTTVVETLDSMITADRSRKLALAYNVTESVVVDMLSKVDDIEIVEALLADVSGKKKTTDKIEEELDDDLDENKSSARSLVRRLAASVA